MLFTEEQQSELDSCTPWLITLLQGYDTRRPLTTQGSEETSPPHSPNIRQSQQLRYLPLSFDGIEVLVHVDGDTWRVDNDTLCATTTGLQYRRSKQLDEVDEDFFAEWGAFVKGFDTGDGWLQTQVGWTVDSKLTFQSWGSTVIAI